MQVVKYPVQVAMNIHRVLEAEVRHTVESWKPDVVVLMLSRMGWLMPALDGVPVVVDFVDSLALNMSMRANRQPALKWLWKWEAARIQKWEQSLLGRVEAGIVVAERDRTRLLKDCQAPGKLKVVPFGIEIPSQREKLEVRPPILVTSGNLGYYPTVDGIRWFGRYVWPRLKALSGDLRWWLVGSRPAASVTRLASTERIELFESPPRIEELLRQASVGIVPLFSGSGVPIKILEAMALEIPVVASSHAVAGLDELREGAVRWTDDPTRFAEMVIGLVESPAVARAQAQSAFAWLEKRHSLEAVALRFESILSAVAAVRKVSS